MDETLIEQLETEESMFVQTAQGIESAGGTLTLRGVTPSTLYFSDRPQRVVGHMTTADFVELWGAGDNSFESRSAERGARVPRAGRRGARRRGDRDQRAAAHRRRAVVLRRGSRRNRSGEDRAGDAVHRPVRAAAVARLGVRRAPTRTATRPQTLVPRARQPLAIQPSRAGVARTHVSSLQRGSDHQEIGAVTTTP